MPSPEAKSQATATKARRSVGGDVSAAEGAAFVKRKARRATIGGGEGGRGSAVALLGAEEGLQKPQQQGKKPAPSSGRKGAPPAAASPHKGLRR